MAYSVNWLTKLITIPQSDLLLLSPGIYQLDLGEFHKEIRRLEWEFNEGLLWEEILSYNPVVVLGGISYAPGIEVINGYTVEFQNGAYAVNLAGANSNVADVSVVNNVSIRPQNSAGLINLDALLSSAYQGQVVVDSVTGQDGTQTPIGMFKTPSKNMTHAIEIAIKQGVRRFYFNRDMALNEDLTGGYELVGGSPFFVVTANPAADLTGCAMRNLTLQGEMDGLNTIRECSLLACTNISGFLEKVSFRDTISVNNDTMIMESYSNRPGSLYPLINVLAGNLIVRDLHGSMGVGMVTSGLHSIGIDGGGRCVIENTCTGGEIHVRGNPFQVIDNSGAGCTVVIETDSDQIAELQTQVKFLVDVAAGRWIIDDNTNQMIFFEPDNVTEMMRFDLKDINGTAAHTKIYERIKV